MKGNLRRDDERGRSQRISLNYLNCPNDKKLPPTKYLSRHVSTRGDEIVTTTQALPGHTIFIYSPIELSPKDLFMNYQSQDYERGTTDKPPTRYPKLVHSK